MYVWWNLTKSLTKIKNCDILVLSIGKSGRTWLRVMINKYISLAYNISFGLEDLSTNDDTIPSIFYTHEMWEHFSKATISQKVLGKYVIPDKFLMTKKVVLLYRDPRDILVSLYFHMAKRSKKRVHIKLADLLWNQNIGIRRIIQVLNEWRQRLENHPSCFWISYEDLKFDPFKNFVNILRFIFLNRVSEDLAKQAVEFADFKNMKKMEAKGEFKSKILQPGDPSDPDSYKVREGKVGGYVHHFSKEELCYLDRAITGLSTFYDYMPLSGSNSPKLE